MSSTETEFARTFREQYSATRKAASDGDKEGALAGLEKICDSIARQVELNNDDKVIDKALLSYWQGVFGGYADILRQYGLQDRRIQKLFGFIEDDIAPSIGDILSGAGMNQQSPIVPRSANGGINPDGTVRDDSPAYSTPRDNQPESDDPITKIIPIEPIVPVDQGGEEPDVQPAPILPDIPTPTDRRQVKPSFAPDSLENFIGQGHIVKVILKEIAIAHAEGRRYLDNIMLLGNPGLGKSTLMELIAKKLGARYEWIDCSQFRNSQQSLKAVQNFLTRVARLGEPVVIAFDEIHMLSSDLQSSLLTLLNSRVYVSPPDVNGVIKRIPIESFTFIAATTDDQDIIPTIKDRCLRLTFQLVDYTPDELRQIYRNKVASKGLTITEDAIDTCIPRSRGSIRYINAFVEGLNVELYNDEGYRMSTAIDKTVAENYFTKSGIDEMGLGPKDREILQTIQDSPSGALGINTLAARVGLEPKKYLSEYEKYLQKIGFLNVESRGRSLTEAAVKYLEQRRGI